MYDTLQQMEADAKAKAEVDGEEVDEAVLKKKMEATLVFNDVHLK